MEMKRSSIYVCIQKVSVGSGTVVALAHSSPCWGKAAPGPTATLAPAPISSNMYRSQISGWVVCSSRVKHASSFCRSDAYRWRETHMSTSSSLWVLTSFCGGHCFPHYIAIFLSQLPAQLTAGLAADAKATTLYR